MWWETVGCDNPTGSVRSHTHISPALLPTIMDMSLTRVGSPRALNTFANSSATPSASTASEVQHDVVSGAVSMVAESVLITSILHDTLTFVDT